MNIKRTDDKILVVSLLILIMVGALMVETCVEELVRYPLIGSPMLRWLLSVDQSLAAALGEESYVPLFLLVGLCILIAPAFLLYDMYATRKE